MKDYSIELDLTTMARVVYEITANVAKERGEAKHIATEDNASLITSFMRNATGLLNKAFGVYSKGYETADKIVLHYSMPENWDIAWAPKKEAESFLAYYAVAKWYELSGGDSALYLARAEEALDNIGYSLNRRKKPL